MLNEIKNKRKMKKKGFTLIELIVVIAILAALSAIAFPSVSHFVEQANNVADAQHARSICSVLLCSHVLYGNVTAENPWGEKHGYVYVDDDELRVSSMAVAKILEENGFIENVGKATMRSGKELTYPFSSNGGGKGFSKIRCQSHNLWSAYQVTIRVDDNKNVRFSYTATTGNGSSTTKDNGAATEAFSRLCQGRSSGDTEMGESK